MHVTICLQGKNIIYRDSFKQITHYLMSFSINLFWIIFFCFIFSIFYSLFYSLICIYSNSCIDNSNNSLSLFISSTNIISFSGLIYWALSLNSHYSRLICSGFYWLNSFIISFFGFEQVMTFLFLIDDFYFYYCIS